MAPTPTASLKEIFRPWWVRLCAGPVAAIGVYDTIAGQAELPTLRRLFGMSTNLLPWWGWLLLLQAIFVAALFEYVRRNVGSGDVQADQVFAYDDSELRADLAKLAAIQARLIEENKILEGKLAERGPTKELEAAVQRNSDISTSMMTIMMGARDREQLLSGIEQFEKYGQIIENHYTVERLKSHGGIHFSIPYGRVLGPLKEIANRLEPGASFGASPGFDKNPGTSAPNDQAIAGEAERFEYRKTYDAYRNDLSILKKVVAKIDERERAAWFALEQIGKEANQ